MRSRGRVALVVALLGVASPAHAQSIFDDGFEPLCPGPSPGVTPGAGNGLLLRGLVVTPAIAFPGEVLVAGDTIICAAPSCADQPGAATATIVETNGLVFPGLIDTRTAIQFAIFDETDWSPLQLYSNHTQYTNEARYRAMVDAKQYLNGEASPVDYNCEMNKYGELKGLLAGTTSIVGAANPQDRGCYGSLARTIDQAPNDLADDAVQAVSLFPSTASADAVCNNFASGSTDAYLVPIGEGRNAAALNEFTMLNSVTTIDGCLYAPQTAIVNGSALGDAQLATMASSGMSLVWQPRSDMTLYGSTANIALARSKGVNVALGTYWPLTGSHNLLDELRFAAQVDAAAGDTLTDQDLVGMVTTNAAQALALDDQIGSIEAGRKADLVVVARRCDAPWSALLATRARDVRLVLVGGVPLYGDASLQQIAPLAPGCETLDVCGIPKFVCVAETGGTVANKLGQTLAQITGALSTGLSDYDAQNPSSFDFAPLTPLFECQ